MVLEAHLDLFSLKETETDRRLKRGMVEAPGISGGSGAASNGGAVSAGATVPGGLLRRSSSNCTQSTSSDVGFLPIGDAETADEEAKDEDGYQPDPLYALARSRSDSASGTTEDVPSAAGHQPAAKLAPDRRAFLALVGTLNATFPDFDFSGSSAEHFARHRDPQSVIGQVNSALADFAVQEARSPMLPLELEAAAQALASTAPASAVSSGVVSSAEHATSASAPPDRRSAGVSGPVGEKRGRAASIGGPLPASASGAEGNDRTKRARADEGSTAGSASASERSHRRKSIDLSAPPSGADTELVARYAKIVSVLGRMGAYVPGGTFSFLDALWLLLDGLVDLGKCEVYTYSPGDDTDVLVAGALWSFNYFFVSRTRKRVAFFYCKARSRLSASALLAPVPRESPPLPSPGVFSADRALSSP
jgi:hypothetical protein